MSLPNTFSKSPRLPKGEIKRLKVSAKVASFLSLVDNIGKLLEACYGLSQNLSSKGKPYIKFICEVGNNRGIATMIKTAKAIRLYVTRHLSGQPLTTSEPGIKLTKDWLPVKLGPDLLRIVRRGTPAEKRWLLTLLYSTRALELPLSPDYESIEAPNRSEKLVNIFAEMKSHRHGFWRAIGLRQKCKQEKIHFKNFHLTTRQGPNGHGLWC